MIYRSLKVGTFSVRCKITGTDFPRHYMDYGLYYHYSGYTFPHIAERKKRDTFAWYDTNNKTVMEEIMQLDNVFQYNELLHCETLHPLVNVIDFSTCTPAEHIRFCLGFYAIFLKDVKCGDIQYGRSTYDYQEGTLVFIAPGQCVGITRRGEMFQPKDGPCCSTPTSSGERSSAATFGITPSFHTLSMKPSIFLNRSAVRLSTVCTTSGPSCSTR